MTTTISTTYCVRLCVESRTGHGWDAVTDMCAGILAAADWRERMRTWCEANPLPAGLEYFIPLPRRSPPPRDCHHHRVLSQLPSKQEES